MKRRIEEGFNQLGTTPLHELRWRPGCRSETVTSVVGWRGWVPGGYVCPLAVSMFDLAVPSEKSFDVESAELLEGWDNPKEGMPGELNEAAGGCEEV